MASDVPTINLFDNDNSGSFFETFNQNGGLGAGEEENTLSHPPASSSSSPFDANPPSHEESSLFGKSDGHSFFDSLGTSESISSHPPSSSSSLDGNHNAATNFNHHSTQQHTPSYQYGAEPDAKDSLFSSSSQSGDPNSLFFENLSISGMQLILTLLIAFFLSFTFFYFFFFPFSFPIFSFSFSFFVSFLSSFSNEDKNKKKLNYESITFKIVLYLLSSCL